jgi:hypothetical protein
MSTRAVAQGDRMHRADVVVHAAAVGDARLTAADVQQRDARGDAAEVGRLEAHRAREQPTAGGPALQAAIQRQERCGHVR